MDFEETMVEDNEEQDEEFLDEVVEEPEEEEEEDLDSLEDEEDSDEDEEPEEPKAKAQEPGYVQRRIKNALARERDSMRAEILAQVEAQYAPIRDRLLEMDARELVRKGEFKSLETAKEYLQLKQGLPTQEPQEQPRNDQGQFVSREDQADYYQTQGRIAELKRQAEKIRETTGIDVIAEWNENEDVHDAIIAGDMDFYDVAEQMQAQKKKRPPSPMRSPNGASGTNPNAITTMSDAQFEKMEKRIKEGARYTLR